MIGVILSFFLVPIIANDRIQGVRTCSPKSVLEMSDAYENCKKVKKIKEFILCQKFHHKYWYLSEYFNVNGFFISSNFGLDEQKLLCKEEIDSYMFYIKKRVFKNFESHHWLLESTYINKLKHFLN